MTNQQPLTTPEARKFFDLAEEIMCTLWARWQDEKEHEDIKDYAKPLQELATKAGVTIIEMTKRPFGVKYSVGTRQFHAFIKGGTSYQYKRIA